MRSKTLLAAAALSAVALTALVVSALGQGQYQPSNTGQVIPAPRVPQAGDVPIPPQTPSTDGSLVPQARSLVASAPPWEVAIETHSIDQLLDGLDALRAQKAELERREKVMAGVLKKKVEKQRDRLEKAGIGGPERPAASGTAY